MIYFHALSRRFYNFVLKNRYPQAHKRVLFFILMIIDDFPLKNSQIIITFETYIAM